MNLFKLDPPIGAFGLVMSNGQPIHGYQSVRWVERYADVGELEIKAKLSSGLRDLLPVGCFVGHTDTLELMIVENHEINEKQSEDPDLTITGRSFVSYLEQRIVGLGALGAGATAITEYIMAPAILSEQIRLLIANHVGQTAAANDAIDGLWARDHIGAGPSAERTLTRGPVLAEVLKLLPLYDLGIEFNRMNPFTSLFVRDSAIESRINVYKGADRSNRIVYSSRNGTLYSVDYLFSNKAYKTSVLVVGRYVMVPFTGGANWQNRQYVVDGTDLDGHLDAAPTGAALTAIQNRMTTRAMAVLVNQHETAIARADAAATDPFKYRSDYFLGDLVSVAGNYGEITKMRIVEYVEIEDENGETGHPTFALPLS